MQALKPSYVHAFLMQRQLKQEKGAPSKSEVMLISRNDKSIKQSVNTDEGVLLREVTIAFTPEFAALAVCHPEMDTFSKQSGRLYSGTRLEKLMDGVDRQLTQPADRRERHLERLKKSGRSIRNRVAFPSRLQGFDRKLVTEAVNTYLFEIRRDNAKRKSAKPEDHSDNSDE